MNESVLSFKFKLYFLILYNFLKFYLFFKSSTYKYILAFKQKKKFGETYQGHDKQKLSKKQFEQAVIEQEQSEQASVVECSSCRINRIKEVQKRQ